MAKAKEVVAARVVSGAQGQPKEEERIAIEQEGFTKKLFTDPKIGDTVFRTRVHIQHFYNTETGRHSWRVDIGENLDKQLLFTGRNDGRGASCLTDWVEFQKLPKETVKADTKDTVI
jgi:hypothetical protein